MEPWIVAITPDGAFAYVANSGSNTVSVIATGHQYSGGRPSPVGAEPGGSDP